MDGASNVCIPAGISTNPLTGLDEVFPIGYARAGSLGGTGGWKGYGTIMKWTGQLRNCGDNLSVVTTKDHIVVGHTAISWSGEAGQN